MTSKVTITAVLITIGAVAGAATATTKFWGDYGWITQSDYREDHLVVASAEQIQDIADLLGDLKEDQDTNHRQWECDELDEEIPELELLLLEAQTNAEKVALNRTLEKKREQWDKLDCSEFTDLD
jgi:hypothetical protein